MHVLLTFADACRPAVLASWSLPSLKLLFTETFDYYAPTDRYGLLQYYDVEWEAYLDVTDAFFAQPAQSATKYKFRLLRAPEKDAKEMYLALITEMIQMKEAVQTLLLHQEGPPKVDIKKETLVSDNYTRELEARLLKQQRQLTTLQSTNAQLTSQLGKLQSSPRQSLLTDKTKLESDVAGILTRATDLRDMMEDLRLDVLQRGVKPNKEKLAWLTSELAGLQTALTETDNVLATLLPSWKQTWEEELSTIVKEQAFVKDAEQTVKDVSEDHGHLTNVFSQLKMVLQMMEKAGPKSPRQFDTATAEEMPNLHADIVAEIAHVSIDSERRLRAIDVAERLRRKAGALKKVDAFEAELQAYVKKQDRRASLEDAVEAIERRRREQQEALLRDLVTAER